MERLESASTPEGLSFAGCLVPTNPELKSAILLVLDSLSSKVIAPAVVSSMQTYASLVRDFEPKVTFSRLKVTNRLDTLAPGLSALSETGLLLAIAYLLKGRGLVEAVKLAALQSGTLLTYPVIEDIPLEDEDVPKQDPNLAVLANAQGLTIAQYKKFKASGALAD